MAVARRKTGKYDNWDTEEGIIAFLERNGFKEIRDNTETSVPFIMGMSKALGDSPVYIVGNYTDDPNSHWIRFYSPKWKGHVFFCRENDIIPYIESEYTSKWSVIVGTTWNDMSSLDSFREMVKYKLGI